MRAWLLALGGLLVWALHFGGVYAIASVADVVAEADAAPARALSGLFTLACAAADGVLLWLIVRRARGAADPLAGFLSSVGALGALFSLVAVLWQGLPALLGH